VLPRHGKPTTCLAITLAPIACREAPQPARHHHRSRPSHPRHREHNLRASAPPREQIIYFFLTHPPTPRPPKIPCHHARKKKKIPCQFPAGREFAHTAPHTVPLMFPIR